MPTPPVKAMRPSTTSSLRCVQLFIRPICDQCGGWYLGICTPATDICSSRESSIFALPTQSSSTCTLTPARALGQRLSELATDIARPVNISLEGNGGLRRANRRQHRWKNLVLVAQHLHLVIRNELRPQQHAKFVTEARVLKRMVTLDSTLDFLFSAHKINSRQHAHQCHRDCTHGDQDYPSWVYAEFHWRNGHPDMRASSGAVPWHSLRTTPTVVEFMRFRFHLRRGAMITGSRGSLTSSCGSIAILHWVSWVQLAHSRLFRVPHKPTFMCDLQQTPSVCIRIISFGWLCRLNF